MAEQIQGLEGLSQEEIVSLARMNAKLLRNKDTRKATMRLLKQVDPDFEAPEVEVDERLAAIEAATAERVKKLEDELQTRDAQAQWNTLKMQPVKAGIITEADLPDLEKYMQENGFNSTQYLQAAKHRKMEQALAPPTPAQLNPFKIAGDNKDLMKNPKQWFRKQTADGVNDMAARQAAGLFGNA